MRYAQGGGLTAEGRRRRELVRLAELDRVLDAGPAASGWADQRWTLAPIRDLIAAKFRVQYTIPGAWYLLRRRGWSCQLGARRATERDDGAVEVWKKETWPRVRGGGSGSVSVGGLACYRPGHRTRLIYRLHQYRGRKGETKAFTWMEYRDLLTAAHHQLPGGNIVLVWDNLSVHLRAELRAFTTAQPWLEVFQLPSYAPDLNPVEGIWSSLKRGPLANVAFTAFAHLLQVIKHGLKKIQYQPALIDGCLAGTGLSLEPDQPTS